MDLLEVLHLDELSHGLANLSMFPYFDMAHYIVSVMALREQPGEWLQVQVSSGHDVLLTAVLLCSAQVCPGGASNLHNKPT